jgi:hypothetical protein
MFAYLQTDIVTCQSLSLFGCASSQPRLAASR